MEDDFADATVPLVAHALLNSMAVITGTLSTLMEASLPDTMRVDLMTRALAQAEHVTGVLQDLVRGLEPGVRTMLEGLDHE